MISKWKNAARFKRKLSKLPKVVEEAARAAMEDFADQVVAAMRNLVPVKTGALRESIDWTWGGPPSDAKIVGHVGGAAQNRITIFAGSEAAYYARWVEFGTRARAPGKYRDEHDHKRNAGAGGHAATPAEPFFYPTWRAYKRKLARTVNPKVYSAIKKLASDQSGN